MDECIAELRMITGMNGIPHHIPPSVFTDAELGKVRTPTLLLIGDREVIYRPEAAMRRAMRLMPNVRAAIIPGANHYGEYTAAPEVNQRVTEFLIAT